MSDEPTDQTVPVVARKIPDADDVDGQVMACVGALSGALLTATDQPLGLLQPHVRALSEQMVAYGWRQTDMVDESSIRAPAWITDGVKQDAEPIPDRVDHFDPDPDVVAIAGESPGVPDHIGRKDLIG